MKSINIDLENCYGINTLKHNFDLKDRKISIYAPNGVMKTSFAKTFRDISNVIDSKDLMFPERKTKRDIILNNESSLKSENVFVIEPYNEEFKSEKMSTLLVNKDLKAKYEEIHRDIDEKVQNLEIKLKKASGLKKGIREELSHAITSERDSFFKAIDRLEKEVLDNTNSEFIGINYTSIFNDKVVKFLTTKNFHQKLEDYLKKYEELIDASNYFKKGIFNHNNAESIIKNLASNGFYQAEHGILLNSSGEKIPVETQEELEKIIQSEKDSILNNPELQKTFQEIDTQLNKNTDLRQFRDFINDYTDLLPKLANLQSLKQNMWVSYLKECKDEYSEVIKAYNLGKKQLEHIESEAKKEKTKWLNVINIFNKRFSVPFKLSIQNQDDVILKSDIPIVKFEFEDSSGEKATVDEAILLKALSNGEKRALYILNIIFEVEARIENQTKTLFIIDDIADSFDYKNKYAIIEYLSDISDNEIFSQILLTHNFDFYRTVQSRFVGRKNSYMVSKDSEKINIIGAEYLRPFEYFKSNYHMDDNILVATIPFVRNLIEYSSGTSDDKYIRLTSLLHIKKDTNNITIKDLGKILNEVLKNNLEHKDPDKKIIDLINERGDMLVDAGANAKINLENKILLSIAIRLNAETFMISKIQNEKEIEEISSNQTFKLFKLYKNKVGQDDPTIRTLELVNLMTPENIHLNSFMYEPILDMSDEHLRKLYSDIKKL